MVATTTYNSKAAKKAVRINISLPALLSEKAEEITRTRGFTGLSDYFQACIRRDSGLDVRPVS